MKYDYLSMYSIWKGSGLQHIEAKKIQVTFVKGCPDFFTDN